jgi:hypothetical protein
MLVAWGDNAYGQTNLTTSSAPAKLIAAGDGFTLASKFAPLVQYQVDVTKDLLLIYNTNSLDSSNVCAYYLQHRPLVGGANVLGIGCSNRPSFFPEEYTNCMAVPISNWLTQNPTKRPQYVILFLGIPWRVNTNALTQYDHWPSSIRESVQYQLNAWCDSRWHPFVTAINMRDSDASQPATNACIAYINKLVSLGTTHSCTNLILSASAAGYSNTNFLFDNVRHGYNWSFCPDACFPEKGYIMSNSVVALEAMALSGIGIEYAEGNEDRYLSNQPPHITNATNVGGYISWGEHSLLGGLYATQAAVRWQGDSGWYLIETIESWNGQPGAGMGDFFQWYSVNAFGGPDYSNTPVGAVTHPDEPGLDRVNDPAIYFGLWAAGKNFAVSAWASRRSWNFQAVGDPFVRK